MKKRGINEERGVRAVDGAGVSLVRVLGHNTTDKFDPFLMLDSFDSKNPDDYTKGFPMHPHRGIETITYLTKGSILHRDSMGNEGLLTDGGVQWMTTGSGLLHEEMPLKSDYMLGIQLWLNLPKEHKMTKPEYHEIPRTKIPEIEISDGILRVVAGEYDGVKGHQGKFSPLSFYAVILKKGGKFTLNVKDNESSFVFLLKGDAKIGDKKYIEKTAVSLSKGTELDIETLNSDVEVLYISAPRLDEPIAWGGPIVMNTQAELRNSFNELRNNTFIK